MEHSSSQTALPPSCAGCPARTVSKRGGCGTPQRHQQLELQTTTGILRASSTSEAVPGSRPPGVRLTRLPTAAAGAPHRPMQPVPQLQPHQHRRAPSAIQAAALEYAAQRRQQVQHQRREEVLAWRQHRDASLSSSGSG